MSIDNSTLRTTTDSTGAWQFNNLPAGGYDVTATKPGFGTFHWYGQQLDGGRLPMLAIILAEMKSYVPQLTGASWTGNGIYGPALYVGFDTTGQSNYPGQDYTAYCDLDSTTQPQDAHLLVSKDWTSIFGDVHQIGFESGDLRALDYTQGKHST